MRNFLFCLLHYWAFHPASSGFAHRETLPNSQQLEGVIETRSLSTTASLGLPQRGGKTFLIRFSLLLLSCSPENALSPRFIFTLIILKWMKLKSIPQIPEALFPFSHQGCVWMEFSPRFMNNISSPTIRLSPPPSACLGTWKIGFRLREN